MSDEQDRLEPPPASEAAPSQAPADSAEESETPPPPAEAEEKPAEAEAPEPPQAEEKPPGEPAAAAPEPEPQPVPAPAANYDGLDSGLAWFGFEPFTPPAPVGYEALPEAAAKAPKAAPSAQELDERRRRIHGRFASRRQEVETQKAWYQRIPLGLLSMVPVLTVLIVVAILYPPWGGGAFPSSKEALDPAVLSATPLPNAAEALRALGVQEFTPHSWRVLPGGILMLPRLESSARLALPVKPGAAGVQISCDICILERDPSNWGAGISVEGAAGITLRDHPKNPGKDYVAGRRAGNTLAGFQHEIKPKIWNRVRVAVGKTETRYFFNGTDLKAAGPRPPSISKAEFNAYNTRLILRNVRIEPLE